MKYHLEASGDVEAENDQEIIEIVKLAENEPGDVSVPHVRVTDPATGRVVYETPTA